MARFPATTAERLAAAAACIATVVSTACSSPDGGLVCTASFAFVTAIAIDSAGAPVDGLVVSDSVLRTGMRFDIGQLNGVGTPGTIVIWDDTHLTSVRRSGDSVRVTGAATARGFLATWQFGSDGCHVRKLSGPDTVVVR